MALPRIEFTPTGGVLQVLASPVPRPGNRLRGFVPDTMPIGPARPVLADGAIYGRRFRADRLARFELPGLSPEQLETAQTLKAHLLNGGTATLATDDSADRSYTIRLAPDTVPEIRGPDERYEYAFAMTALNTAAASMVCTYGDAAVIWRADYLNAFTRASLASYHGGPSPLRILSAASGVPRYQHYQDGRRGLLVEGAATNSLLHSNDPSNAAWVKTAITYDGGNPVLTPQGTLVGLLAETAVNSAHHISQAITIADGQVVTASGYFRARERSRGELVVLGGGSAFWVIFNNGVIVERSQSGTGNSVRGYIETDFADLGWYRYVVVGTLGSGITSATARFHLYDDTGAATYLGDVSKGAYWWGMQAEPGETVASTLIPTTTTAVTRNADEANIVVPFGPQPMWVYHLFTERGTIGTTDARAWHLGTTAAPHLYVKRDVGGTYAVNHHNGTLGTDVPLGVAPDIGDQVEILVQLDEQGEPDIYQSVNGAAPTSVIDGGTQIGFATAWGSSLLWLGSDNGASVGYAPHERLVIGRGSLGSGAARVMAKARSIAG